MTTHHGTLIIAGLGVARHLARAVSKMAFADRASKELAKSYLGQHDETVKAVSVLERLDAKPGDIAYRMPAQALSTLALGLATDGGDKIAACKTASEMGNHAEAMRLLGYGQALTEASTRLLEVLRREYPA